jgi:hypothetical protein
MGATLPLAGYPCDQNSNRFSASREFGGALGYRFSNLWRVEAAYSRRWAKITGLNGALTTKGDFDARQLGLHLFRDLRQERQFQSIQWYRYRRRDPGLRLQRPCRHQSGFHHHRQRHDHPHVRQCSGGATYHIRSKLRVGSGFENVPFSDQGAGASIGDIDGINRSGNFFVSMRGRPDFSRQPVYLPKP